MRSLRDALYSGEPSQNEVFNNPMRGGSKARKGIMPMTHSPLLLVIPLSSRKGPATDDETPSSSRVGALARRIEGAPFDTPPSAATQGEADTPVCRTGVGND